MWSHQIVFDPPGIAAKTRPRALSRIAYQPAAHRIQLDISMAGEQISVGLDRTGTESSFPKRPGASMEVVEIGHVAAAHALDSLRRSLVGESGRDQVNMIRHEHVGMHLHSTAATDLHQATVKVDPVALGPEDRLAIVTADANVGRDSGNGESTKAGHGVHNARRALRTTRILNWSLTPIIWLVAGCQVLDPHNMIGRQMGEAQGAQTEAVPSPPDAVM